MSMTEEKEKGEKEAKILSVFSLKGGVGKTVVAVNLALALSQLETGAKVVIIDLNLYSGDACSALNLKPKWTISEVAENIEFYQAADIEKVLTEYSPRLKVLAAPLHPELAEVITPEIIHRIIKLLAATADYIVIDCPSFFNPVILAAIEHVDRFLLVATVDLLAIKAALICLQTLQLLNYPRTKIKFILNRSKSRVGISDREIERSLGVVIWADIPSGKMVPLSLNVGEPLVSKFPKTAVARSFVRLAQHVKNDLQRKEKIKKWDKGGTAA